ncbi:MAG: tol-pal system protein YbgF [Deltaproteobacteria bacterium]|nr:tol-pal system protein YbgF [Deltaproteobacteria bacterium]
MRRSGILLLLTSLVLAGAAGGCAVADQGAFVRLQEEVESVKKEVAAVRATAASHPAPLPRTEAREVTGVEKTVADLSADTDRIKSDLLAATTRAEENKLALQKDIADLASRTTDQAQAIADLKAKAARMDELERKVTVLEAKVEKLAEAVRPAAGAASAGPSPAAQDWKSPEEMYDYALGLIKGGETKKAREILLAFAAKYPDHRLMPNVLYWKGETFYAEKDYENAILAFQDVIDKYPGGDKTPDAMLKQGMSFLGLNDRKNAKLLFELVVSKHPKSPAAEKARAKLAALK